jgi:hypothetical protein
VAEDQLNRLVREGTARPEALAANLAAADELGQRLSAVTDRVPRRFTDPAVRQRFARALGAVPPTLSPEASAMERTWAHLNSPFEPANSGGLKSILGKGTLGSLLERTVGNGTIGRVFKGALGGKALGVVATAAVIDTAAHALVHGLGHGIPMIGAGLAAARVALPLLARAFADPQIGGLIVGGASQVLRSAHPGPNQARSPGPNHDDPRVALRDLAERIRTADPAGASHRATAALASEAGHAPLSVAAAGQASERRLAYLKSVVDRSYPPPTPEQLVLGRPLPSLQAANDVADAVRGLSSPMSVPLAALSGRLTPGMAKAHAVAFPATAKRFNQSLLGSLGRVRNPMARMDPRARLMVSSLLGPTLGGGDSRADYRAKMQQLSQAANGAGQPPPQARPPQPPGPIGANPFAPASMVAAHPGWKR